MLNPREFDELFSRSPNSTIRPAGSMLFSEGEPAESAYVILAGEVEILMAGKVLEVAGKGSLVGEMALLDNSPRSASARARSDVRVVPIDQKQMLFLIQQTPFFALNVMRLMADRLRGMNRLA